MARLGPLLDEITTNDVAANEPLPPPPRRKPGRHPGRRTVNASPLQGASSKKRLASVKPHVCRRKLTDGKDKTDKANKRQRKNKDSTSDGIPRDQEGTTSENLPIWHGAGGLALFWKQELHLKILDSSPNVIDTIIVFEGKKFYSFFVYGNTDKKLRQNLWDHLLGLALSREDAWSVTGDLNDILSNDEKNGGSIRLEGSFSSLRTFFSEADLFDLQHTGDPLSWMGKRGNDVVRCRLDRAVANTRWAECFPSARCQYLGFEGSDHKPLISLLIKVGEEGEAKKIVADAWISDPFSTVTEKLVTARSAISAWNHTQQQNSMKIIEQKREELNAALSRPVEDTSLIQEISTQLSAAYAAEEEYWKQQIRLLWLNLGDRNT
ncbi:uncharacterized protein LOC106422427 [Brassica napus]|uniref:uncharacterized protein LOC106292208 n=1 Tax=Brassica oleracea var. oleracea TaxID=109376 RepID=UPI0006A73116|nr:PREDICTED: uncharacterized protein LOC106292208 [Brassica oleracea var. oleracea]XP_013718672.1 uncharacterized protein LOC106422427 [Brassica napus]